MKPAPLAAPPRPRRPARQASPCPACGRPAEPARLPPEAMTAIRRGLAYRTADGQAREADLTLGEMARLTGYSPGHLHNCENPARAGRPTLPSPGVCRAYLAVQEKARRAGWLEAALAGRGDANSQESSSSSRSTSVANLPNS